MLIENKDLRKERDQRRDGDTGREIRSLTSAKNQRIDWYWLCLRRRFAWSFIGRGDNGWTHLVISLLSSLSLDCSPIPRSKLLSVTQRRRTKIILRLGQAWISSMHCLSSFVENVPTVIRTHAMSGLLAPTKTSIRESIVVISGQFAFSSIFINRIQRK